MMPDRQCLSLADVPVLGYVDTRTRVFISLSDMLAVFATIPDEKYVVLTRTVIVIFDDRIATRRKTFFVDVLSVV